VEGETLQILASEAKTLDQPLYFQIIAKKTASLFSAAAALGATAAGAPPEWLDALHQYALHLGLAFQVIDDVLDLAADSLQLGKNAGIDIVQGRGIAVALMGNGHRMDFQDGQFLEEVIRKGREKAYEWAARAVAGLCGLPPSPARDELAELAVQIVERDR
jgi:octaprenyl-diphosphate synthase